ncbi:diaminopimelate epimerase [Natronosalvus rutilus]|uniref:Diaminopimelate epimerase n=1 Tax=Natronosalvus rutilus TaxID=2953753 RepID=A0A9E7NC67_9EURY|nr:diaminopimelate epimerase [Natronosalvus rutilus]UTF54681.1 diaminopimelate epimerase [Natronosalvus rutilus]
MSAFADVHFEKYHGTGNDFLVIDAETYVPDRRGLAARECDREAGVGADGILFLALEDRYNPPRVIMTLVQPDGGTAPMCGNGARCAGRWAMERTGSDEVMIDTQAGTRHAYRVESDGSNGSGEEDQDQDDRIAVEMGEPTFDPKSIPVLADDPVVEESIEGLEVTVVNTGVPHAVAFVEDVDAVNLEAVAKPVRHAEDFPLGTNVNLASVEGDGFRQRTFERGVEGETDACGTGAVAIAAAARRLGLADGDSISVSPPGGDLEVVFDGDTATLIGPVEHEFDGEVQTTHFSSFDP